MIHDFSTTPPKLIRRKINAFQDNQDLQIVFPYSLLPLLEATIIKTRYISNYSPFSSVKPAHVLSLRLVPRKLTDQKFHKSFTDQIQHMITEWKVLIFRTENCHTSFIRNITIALHRKSLTRDLNTIIHSTLQIKENIFEIAVGKLSHREHKHCS